MKRVDGRLARSDDRFVVVGKPDGPPLTLRVAPGTAVTLDGRPTHAEELPPGADVRAAYRTGDGGRPTAITIEARLPPQPRPDDGAPGEPAAARPADPDAERDGPPPASWQGAPDAVPPDAVPPDAVPPGGG